MLVLHRGSFYEVLGRNLLVHLFLFYPYHYLAFLIGFIDLLKIKDLGITNALVKN